MSIHDAASLKAFAQRFRVEPGRKVELKRRTMTLPIRRASQAGESRRPFAPSGPVYGCVPGQAVRREQARAADHAASNGRGGWTG